MIEAPIPKDEANRIRTLRDLDVLYTPAEDRFDRITRLACRLLDVPVSLVSLVAERCQWFKSVKGLEATETPRAISFCSHAILENETLVVPDAIADARFADNPLVAGPPHIRFYAGHPLIADNGSRLGTLCVIDRKPRTPSSADLETLRDLAGWVSNELRVTSLSRAQQELMAERDDLRRKALLDPLTQLWNRRAIVEVLDREVARAGRESSPVSVLLADIDHFKQINDTHGHPAGDAVLRGVAKNLRSAVRPYDAVGRYGGEEFLIVFSDCGPRRAPGVAERVRQRVASAYETPAGELQATLSAGLVSWSGGASLESARLIEVADKALYAAKRAGRNRVEIAALDAVHAASTAE